MDLVLEVAKQTAQSAGEIQRGKYESKDLSIDHKGRIDLVTEVDFECERLITGILADKFPDHGIIAEEGTSRNPQAEYQWIIDPLDGTTNFTHGFPIFAVSIGLVRGGSPVAGVVYEPIRDEMFYAVKDGGAFMNGKPIEVTKTATLKDSLLATGFPYDVATNPKNNIDNFRRVIMECQALRRPGAAAIDLVYVACGRLDGFWELRLQAWDMAAGALIVAEAGGILTDMKGGKLDLFGETVCATNGHIHREILQLLEV
jgi:myo-inositol-1(or 4)-monophosphatase